MLVKTVLLVLSCVHYGAGISCFDCTSVNNSMCLDPHLYDPETLHRFLRVTECRRGVLAGNPDAQVHFFCRKIEQTILHKHYEPEVRITRGCGWKRHFRECYKADNEDHLETVCQCFTDQCNTASGLRAYSNSAGSVLRFLVYVYILFGSYSIYS